MPTLFQGSKRKESLSVVIVSNSTWDQCSRQLWCTNRLCLGYGQCSRHCGVEPRSGGFHTHEVGMELLPVLLPHQARTSPVWLFAIHHYGMGESSSNWFPLPPFHHLKCASLSLLKWRKRHLLLFLKYSLHKILLAFKTELHRKGHFQTCLP